MLSHLSAQFPGLFLYTALATLTPTATQTLSASFWSLTGGGWGDPAIVAAVIGAGVAIIVAIYQTRQNHKIECEKNKIEWEKEEQQRLHDQEKEEQQRLYEQQREREKGEQQLRHEQEMARFRYSLNTHYRIKELEENKEETIQREMRRAQNNVSRAVAYRKALHVDPQISRLQILDMQRPLEVTNIYIRVRVHEDTVMRYTIEPYLAAAAQRRDPERFFQARHRYLEKRVDTAVDPAAAIRKYRRCIVVGDPGAGKTTLLKYLALMLADGKYPDLSDLPIHVELNAFVYSEDRDLLDYAARRWEERYAFPQVEARGYMDRMLSDGKAILLLDALDETVVGEQLAQADASYQQAWEAIMRLATRYQKACIVVTARKAGYQQHRQLDGFTVVEVLDFRKEDIHLFVNNWFGHTQGVARVANAANLIARLDRSPRIHALAANPLLLSLIVLVYEAQLDLPDRRAELYRECVDVLLAKWDAKRNIRRRRIFKPDQKRQLLAEVAWHFHLQGRRYFPVQDLLTEIAHFLPALGLSAEDNELVLQEIASENGLLKEQARGWYGFLHLTLQEYFAATAVNDQGRFATLVSQCADPWWEEVLLLYAGQTSDASPLLFHLLGKDSPHLRKDDLFHTNLLTAGRCLASSPTIREKNLREEIVERIFALFLQTPYLRLRRQTIEVLGMISGDAVTSRLVSLVKDTQIDRVVRTRIAWALIQLRALSVAPDLVEMLKDDQITDGVRGDIAVALGWLGERLVVPDLIKMLEDTQIADELRGSVAGTLGMLGERSVVPDLIKMLKDSRIADVVRGDIAVALVRLGEQSVIPDLIKMLKDTQIADVVRGDIAVALGWLGERVVVPDLVEMLKDSQIPGWVRAKIAEALGRLGEKAIAQDLMEILRDTQGHDLVRAVTAVALGQLGESSVIPDLRSMLKDRQITYLVRSGVAVALWQFGERLAVQNLVAVLRNNQIHDWLRSKIANVLGSLAKDEQTINACVLLLSQASADVADAIYDALWKMSRRAEVTIIVHDDGNGETVEFVSWQAGVKQ